MPHSTLLKASLHQSKDIRIVEELRTPFASPSNKAMQTDGGLAAAADRQGVRRTADMKKATVSVSILMLTVACNKSDAWNND